MIMIDKLILRGAALAFAACAISPAAWADTATGSLDVSATVTDNCTVTADAVAFPDVDAPLGTAVNGTGTLHVTCTNGAAWSAAADIGGGSGATLATRKMTSGANTLNYALYTDSQREDVWGDGTASSTTFDATGTGSDHPQTIYASVLGNQTAAFAGDYTDTVGITVTYE